MRIATWNVNSLKARLEKVTWWLERARPDVLLMQETKLADSAAPVAEFREAGYELAHHGEGQWNGVAIASRSGISDVVTNFGEPLGPARTPDVGDDEPLAEARMIAATCGGVRVVSLYAPNGRSLGSPFYQAKLGWYQRLAQWLERAADPAEPLVLGGDFNVAPEDLDVWDPAAFQGSHARLAGGTGGVRPALSLGTGRRVPAASDRGWTLHLVGLSGGGFSQELRDADRSSAGDAGGGGARGVGGDRSRSAQGEADSVGPRAAAGRPR